MSHPLNFQCLETFEKVTKKILALEWVLLEQGILKPYWKDSHRFFASNDKPRFWLKNKNVVNDGVTNGKWVQTVTIPTKLIITKNPPNNHFDLQD